MGLQYQPAANAESELGVAPDLSSLSGSSPVAGRELRRRWWAALRKGQRACAAGAFASCLLAAAALALTSFRVGGGARAAGQRDADAHQGVSELVMVKGRKKAEMVPDMGMGFPTGTYWPTLFCFSVMNAKNNDEIATIKGQLRNRTGIFACDNVAVLSAKKIYLGKGHKKPDGQSVKVYSWVNPANPVPMGNLQGGDSTNSFKNTEIFINAWNILAKSGAIFGHNWTVKVDPDAVFFPERLRWHLKHHTWGTEARYFKNCKFKGPQLYGALEVFNEAAMRKYKENGRVCSTQLAWQGWGEDEWIDKCMSEKLGATAINDYTLVGDHRCMNAECEDTWRPAFHDYKTEALYYNCWKRSMDAEKWKKKEVKRQQELKEGGYFCCVSSWNPSNPCNSCQDGSKQSPGHGYCGGSRTACKKCGQQSHWCKSAGQGKYRLA